MRVGDCVQASDLCKKEAPHVASTRAVCVALQRQAGTSTAQHTALLKGPAQTALQAIAARPLSSCKPHAQRRMNTCKQAQHESVESDAGLKLVLRHRHAR